MWNFCVLHYGSGIVNLSLCKRWILIRQWEYICMLTWSLQMTEWLARLFDPWIVKVPTLRIEREFVESRAILLAELQWRTSCSCQDSGHHLPSFVQPATHCLYPLHNLDSVLLVCDSSQQQTPTSSEGNKFVTSCYLLHFWRWKWRSGSETCVDEGNG
jgi:hypothetical protein